MISSYLISTENYELLDSSGRNATTVYLRLTDDQRMSCVQLVAVDDVKLEWPRNFTVKIEEIGTNSLNIIYPNEIRVVITDNDGEFIIMFPDTYTLWEGIATLAMKSYLALYAVWQRRSDHTIYCDWHHRALEVASISSIYIVVSCKYAPPRA